ncbi:fibronectin type III domain-containing protein [candidate division CSSED10-310 bacterium]|uniref:Fibronectin type III domain-containing protein n=1 Tax=candidate division CSSED10-310 bacterium TaxID=2855610 RepID=A0ABV6YSD4_UNCC1
MPRLVVPQAPGKFKAEMECKRIHFSFVLPKKNTDGSTFTDLYGIQVYRKRMKAQIPPLFDATPEEVLTSVDDERDSEKQDTMIEELTTRDEDDTTMVAPTPTPVETEKTTGMRHSKKSFQDTVDIKYEKLQWMVVDKKFKRAFELSLEELTKTEDAGFIEPPLTSDDSPTIHFFDTGERLKHGFQHEEGYVYSYQYQIRLINENDDYSSFSKKALVYFALIPSPPSDIHWERMKSGIRLYWDPPLTMCDDSPLKKDVYFNIYKREEEKRYSNNPINTVPIIDFNYQVKNLELDEKYFFQIRTVQITPYRQSIPCPEFEVVIKDAEPPSPPRKLIAIGGFNLVSLLWEAPKDRDIQGYNLYRTTSLDLEWQKINEEIIEGTTFVDRSVDIKNNYYYAVTAVDDSPQENESEQSNVQKVVFR